MSIEDILNKITEKEVKEAMEAKVEGFENGEPQLPMQMVAFD